MDFLWLYSTYVRLLLFGGTGGPNIYDCSREGRFF